MHRWEAIFEACHVWMHKMMIATWELDVVQDLQKVHMGRSCMTVSISITSVLSCTLILASLSTTWSRIDTVSSTSSRWWMRRMLCGTLDFIRLFSLPCQILFKLTSSRVHVVLVIMRRLAMHAHWEHATTRVLCGHLILETLCIALISQDLFLLESLLGKANLNFYNGAFINDASSWLTLVDKELLTSDHDCLTFFKVAHGTTEEVWLENLALDQPDGLSLFLGSFCESFLCWPNRCNSDHSDTFRHAWVHLDFCAVWDHTEEWSTILDKEFVLLNLEHLPFEEARSNTVREVWFEHLLQELTLADFNPAQWHKIYPLNLFRSCNAWWKLDTSVCRDFAKIVRASGRDKELDVADLKVSVLLKDSCS